jgi:hypothetical protein
MNVRRSSHVAFIPAFSAVSAENFSCANLTAASACLIASIAFLLSAASAAHLASRLSIVIPAERHSRNAVSSFDSISANLRTRYSAFVSLTFKSRGMHLPFRNPSISISVICFISSHSATSHSDTCFDSLMEKNFS